MGNKPIEHDIIISAVTLDTIMFNMSSSSGSSCSTAPVVPSENREHVSGCGYDSTNKHNAPTDG